MNNGNKSRKGLLAVTVLTILAIASVVLVYAALIGTFEGGEVTIGGPASGSVTYSSDNSTWTATLTPGSVDASWYSRLSINGGQYSGTAVTISWQLQRKATDSSWSNLGTPTTTSMSLGAGAQVVYATGNGLADGNRDWGIDVTEQGTYRVVATVNSA